MRAPIHSDVSSHICHDRIRYSLFSPTVFLGQSCDNSHNTEGLGHTPAQSLPSCFSLSSLSPLGGSTITMQAQGHWAAMRLAKSECQASRLVSKYVVHQVGWTPADDAEKQAAAIKVAMKHMRPASVVWLTLAGAESMGSRSIHQDTPSPAHLGQPALRLLVSHQLMRDIWNRLITTTTTPLTDLNFNWRAPGP